MLPNRFLGRFFVPGLFLLAFFCGPLALAQNTGGVFGPIVNEGHRSLQYRSAFELDNYGFAQRLHYQHALSGDFMWRAIVQSRKSNDSDADFDFVQGELFWHLSEDAAKWQTGVRFDLRIRSNAREEMFGFNWMSEWQLTPRINARFLTLLSRDFGRDADSDVSLQTRAHFAVKLDGGPTLGIELFNAYGDVGDFNDFDDQRHQIGPFVTASLPARWQVFVGSLFGMTDATPDAELRLWFTRSL